MADLEFLRRAKKLRARAQRTESELDGFITAVEEDRFFAEFSRDSQPAFLLERDDSVSIQVVLPDGKYSFESTILSAEDERTFVRVVFGAPRRLEKTQLRQYARETILLPVKFTCAGPTPSPRGAVAPAIVISGNTLDLSAGGARIHVEKFKGQRPSLGTVGRMEITLTPKEPVIQGEAKVVWIKSSNDASLQFAVEFQLISDRSRDRIVRFIFSHQAEMRKRGLA